ncbi:hypothetical protein VQ042_04300 [Aurantimonas sp. A2-1-M11]|uniref:hypothetical protein n=1 Tax=Aurantimonas sp. A2-1-M11 TaxID=3113712 RepID=UPI002F92ADA4
MTTPRDPQRPSQRNHTLWIVLTVLVVAGIVYFLFFTATPEDSTRDAVGDVPSEASEAPPPAGSDPITLPAE